MKENLASAPAHAPRASIAPVLYAALIAVMALTGFGQMPIYNRYYLSDVPGLGWLADFYVTRLVHYIGAAALLGLLSYAAADFLLSRKKNFAVTKTGWLRLAMLATVIVTGALIVVKNFPYVHFSDGFIIALDLAHMGAVMALLLTSLACRIAKKRWATTR